LLDDVSQLMAEKFPAVGRAGIVLPSLPKDYIPAYGKRERLDCLSRLRRPFSCVHAHIVKSVAEQALEVHPCFRVEWPATAPTVEILHS
jgi:hypothetical protein